MSEPEDMSPEAIAERRSRWLSVGTSASALPTRAPGARAELARTKRWEGEHKAARELKANGVPLPRLADAPKMLAEVGG